MGSAVQLSLRLGRILGIPIYLHVSLLLIIPLFAFVIANSTAAPLGLLPLGFGRVTFPGMDPLGTSLLRFVLGMIVSVVLFASILLHEIGHSIVAVRHGVSISRITLWIFGGVSSMEDIPREPRLEERIALMGPVTSGILGGVFLGAYLLTGPTTGEPLGKGVATSFSILGTYNLSLAAFNLIPAFPMDGGRVLRAAFAKRMDFVRATDRAAEVGKAFALVFGFVGVVVGLNIWLLVIAFFIYMAATEEQRATRVTVSLEGVPVSDLMDTRLITVDPSMSVRELLERMMHEKQTGFPVVQDGKVIGVVSLKHTEKVAPGAQGVTRVDQVMDRNVVTLRPTSDAVEALRALGKGNAERALVMEGDRLVGTLTMADLSRAVAIMGQRRAS